MIRTKRVYAPPSRDDGLRILVDRLWPRGLTKEKAKVDLWLKEIAPSNRLRKWYSHDPEKWPQFKMEYAEELKAHPQWVDLILQKMKEKNLSFLYSSKEDKLNNAVALKEYIEARETEVKG
jgi:uncharacterized protein YeaO (DUF488 family)